MQTESLIKVPPGETIFPFANQALKQVDLADYYRRFNSRTPNWSEALLQAGIEFEEVTGLLSVHASAAAYNLVRAITPMGPVKIEVENNNGHMEVKSLPLFVNLSWNITSLTEFNRIFRYEPRFLFDQTILTYHYIQEHTMDLPQQVKYWFIESSILPLLTSTDIKTPTGYKPVLLPFTTAITSIGFGMAVKL